MRKQYRKQYRKLYIIRLSKIQQEKAAQLAVSTLVPGRVRSLAGILLAAHNGQTDQEIAICLGTSVATVQRTRKRFVTEGFDAAVRWQGMTPTLEPSRPPVEPGWSEAIFERTREIKGLIGVAIVDYASGTCIEKRGGGNIDLDIAAASNTEVVRAKLTTIENLNMNSLIEDILITLSTQYHLIRLLPNTHNLFLYIILDRQSGNLALARHQLKSIDGSDGR